MLLFGAVCLGASHSAPSQADDEFRVVNAEIALIDAVYRLDARLALSLSAPAREALESGVPLIIEIQVQVSRNFWHVWDHTIASLSQFYQLEYHALTRQYLLFNQNSGTRRNFSNLATALYALGTVHELPVLDQRLLDPDETYDVRVRARLDIEALPTPLRLAAYLNSDWRLASEWHSWPLP
jgi:hypothetical protein